MHTATALVDRRKRQAVGDGTPSSDPHVRSTRSTNSQQRFEDWSGPARFQFPVSTFPAPRGSHGRSSPAAAAAPATCPCRPAGLVHGPWRALPCLDPSPPPSPPPSVPCPHLIAPLILAPLRNRLDDVPFRLNFFLGVLAVQCCAALQSVNLKPVKQVRACLQQQHSLPAPTQSATCTLLSAGPVLFPLTRPTQDQPDPGPKTCRLYPIFS